MHWSRFAPPHFLLHRLLPVSDPLSYHRTTSHTYSSPEEHIDRILGANSKPVPRNYKIRKLLDTTLVSSLERFRYALESSQRLTDEGRRAAACRSEAAYRSLKSPKDDRGRIYDKWRRCPQICALRSVHLTSLRFQNHTMIWSQSSYGCQELKAAEGNWGPGGQNRVHSCPASDCWDGKGRRTQKRDILRAGRWLRSQGVCNKRRV